MFSSSVFSARSLCFSAFRAGGLRGLVFRPSSRSGSGFVVVAQFARPQNAARWARLWSGRLGVSVAVRGGGLSVSVPCARPRHSVCLALCRPLFFGGGVRGLVRGLAVGGLV